MCCLIYELLEKESLMRRIPSIFASAKAPCCKKDVAASPISTALLCRQHVSAISAAAFPPGSHWKGLGAVNLRTLNPKKNGWSSPTAGRYKGLLGLRLIQGVQGPHEGYMRTCSPTYLWLAGNEGMEKKWKPLEWAIWGLL